MSKAKANESDKIIVISDDENDSDSDRISNVSCTGDNNDNAKSKRVVSNNDNVIDLTGTLLDNKFINSGNDADKGAKMRTPQMSVNQLLEIRKKRLKYIKYGRQKDSPRLNLLNGRNFDKNNRNRNETDVNQNVVNVKTKNTSTAIQRTEETDSIDGCDQEIFTRNHFGIRNEQSNPNQSKEKKIVDNKSNGSANSKKITDSFKNHSEDSIILDHLQEKTNTLKLTELMDTSCYDLEGKAMKRELIESTPEDGLEIDQPVLEHLHINPNNVEEDDFTDMNVTIPNILETKPSILELIDAYATNCIEQNDIVGKNSQCPTDGINHSSDKNIPIPVPLEEKPSISELISSNSSNSMVQSDISHESAISKATQSSEVIPKPDDLDIKPSISDLVPTNTNNSMAQNDTSHESSISKVTQSSDVNPEPNDPDIKPAISELVATNTNESMVQNHITMDQSQSMANEITPTAITDVNDLESDVRTMISLIFGPVQPKCAWCFQNVHVPYVTENRSDSLDRQPDSNSSIPKDVIMPHFRSDPPIGGLSSTSTSAPDSFERESLFSELMHSNTNDLIQNDIIMPVFPPDATDSNLMQIPVLDNLEMELALLEGAESDCTQSVHTDCNNSNNSNALKLDPQSSTLNDSVDTVALNLEDMDIPASDSFNISSLNTDLFERNTDGFMNIDHDQLLAYIGDLSIRSPNIEFDFDEFMQFDVDPNDVTLPATMDIKMKATDNKCDKETKTEGTSTESWNWTFVPHKDIKNCKQSSASRKSSGSRKKDLTKSKKDSVTIANKNKKVPKNDSKKKTDVVPVEDNLQSSSNTIVPRISEILEKDPEVCKKKSKKLRLSTNEDDSKKVPVISEKNVIVPNTSDSKKTPVIMDEKPKGPKKSSKESKPLVFDKTFKIPKKSADLKLARKNQEPIIVAKNMEDVTKSIEPTCSKKRENDTKKMTANITEKIEHRNKFSHVKKYNIFKDTSRSGDPKEDAIPLGRNVKDPRLYKHTKPTALFSKNSGKSSESNAVFGPQTPKMPVILEKNEEDLKDTKKVRDPRISKLTKQVALKNSEKSSESKAVFGPQAPKMPVILEKNEEDLKDTKNVRDPRISKLTKQAAPKNSEKSRESKAVFGPQAPKMPVILEKNEDLKDTKKVRDPRISKLTKQVGLKNSEKSSESKAVFGPQAPEMPVILEKNEEDPKDTNKVVDGIVKNPRISKLIKHVALSLKDPGEFSDTQKVDTFIDKHLKVTLQNEESSKDTKKVTPIMDKIVKDPRICRDPKSVKTADSSRSSYPKEVKDPRSSDPKGESMIIDKQQEDPRSDRATVIVDKNLKDPEIPSDPKDVSTTIEKSFKEPKKFAALTERNLTDFSLSHSVKDSAPSSSKEKVRRKHLTKKVSVIIIDKNENVPVNPKRKLEDGNDISLKKGEDETVLLRSDSSDSLASTSSNSSLVSISDLGFTIDKTKSYLGVPAKVEIDGASIVGYCDLSMETDSDDCHEVVTRKRTFEDLTKGAAKCFRSAIDAIRRKKIKKNETRPFNIIKKRRHKKKKKKKKTIKITNDVGCNTSIQGINFYTNSPDSQDIFIEPSVDISTETKQQSICINDQLLTESIVNHSNTAQSEIKKSTNRETMTDSSKELIDSLMKSMEIKSGDDSLQTKNFPGEKSQSGPHRVDPWLRNYHPQMDIMHFGDNIWGINDRRRRGLRVISIDGSNVAYGHSRGKYFSVEGLKICIEYFVSRGHTVKAFVPHFRVKQKYSSNPALLQELHERDLVVFTPSREFNRHRICSYDDRFIVQYAAMNEGIVVSNDSYKDIAHENPSWIPTIEYRILMPTWVENILIFPPDPLGRFGPTLEEFLRFPSH